MKDVVVIGAGPGGYVAALRAAQLGAEVTLIEKDELGGTCLNRGCIPSKALLRSVEVYRTAREGAAFGVQSSGVRLDWATAQARKQHVVGGLVAGIGRLLDSAGVEILHGEAQFVSPDAVSVSGREPVLSRQFIIATGSHTFRPPISDLDLPGVIDGEAALELTEIPASVCIIGGGAIGVEFATLFAGAGSEVTLIEMLPRLLPTLDRSLGTAIETSLRHQGVQILTSARVSSVSVAEGGLCVSVVTETGLKRLEARKVLLAVGRRPTVEGLGLDLTGVRYDAAGIPVDERMRTNVSTIRAIGDVAQGYWQLAHVASQEAVVAAEGICGQSSRMRYDAVPACVFSAPEVASVGLSEEQARERGHDLRVGTFPLTGNGRAHAYGAQEGFVRLVAEAEYGQVLGIHAVGPHVSELIIEGAMAITLEATLEEFASTIHPHPSIGEAISEAALAAGGRALHSLGGYRREASL